MANPWLKKNPLMSMWLSAVLAAARTRGWTARVRFDGLSALMRPARRAGASRTGPEPRETVRHAAALAPAAQPRPAPPGRALPAAHDIEGVDLRADGPSGMARRRLQGLVFNSWSEVGPISGSRNVVSLVGLGGCLLLLEQILQSHPVAGPDFVSDIVEQFEHGESLLGRPSGGDFDVDGTQMHGQGRRRRRAHGLAARRCRARCSARS